MFENYLATTFQSLGHQSFLHTTNKGCIFIRGGEHHVGKGGGTMKNCKIVWKRGVLKELETKRGVQGKKYDFELGKGSAEVFYLLREGL